MPRSANAATSAAEVSGDGGTGVAERDHERDLAGVADAARREVVVQQQRASLGAGGHLNGAPQTPTTARPSVKLGSSSASRSAPATE